MSKTVTQEAVYSAHAVHLLARKAMEIEGVEQIIAFDERQVLLRTGEGRMQITGRNLQVTALQPDSGKAHVDGEIDSVSYMGKKAHGSRNLMHIFR